MILYGASGHAKVVIESITASGEKIVAIFDDNEAIKKILTYNVLGKYDDQTFPDQQLIISVGANSTRKKIAQRLKCKFGKSIHPSAWISPTAILEEGTVVMGGAVLNADVRVGKHVIVNTSCSIDHDSQVDDFVHVSPGATLCGGVTVGEGTHIGAGATVIQNIRIGKWVIIGAGSVVVDDIPDYAVVRGVPGRIIKIQEVSN